MIIQEINQASLKEALSLVKETFDIFQADTYHPEGIKTFDNFIAESSISNAIVAEKVVLYGYFIKNRIVGVLGIRQPNHICLLFVDQHYHRQGIASALVNNWFTTCKPTGTITVNASSYAVSAYEKMGFSSTNSLQTVDGITFVPMETTLLSSDSRT